MKQCCKFPTFAAILIVIGVVWLLNDLNVFSINIPWLPLVLIVLGAGWIVDSQKKK
ncbi:MAG: hypothetical protein ABH879_08155 [archaeon]